MIDINELRRLAQAANASHDGDVMSWIEGMQRLQGALIPDDVIELLGRLEAAEKERDEFKRACFGHISDNSMLRAKIEAMEKQAPVAFVLYSGWARKAVYLSEIEACEQRDRRQLTADLSGSLEAYRVVPLYLAPGAQPAPSVPDVDALAQFIRKVDGAHQLGAAMLAERIAGWLAASPEAKPCP